MPDNLNVNLVEYQAYRRLGDVEKAEGAFATVAVGNPQRAGQVLFDEGKALFEANDVASATPLLEQAIKLFPELAEANYYLGLCKLNQNAVAEAKPLLAKFLELAPNNPNAAAARDMLDALQ